MSPLVVVYSWVLDVICSLFMDALNKTRMLKMSNNAAPWLKVLISEYCWFVWNEISADH